MHKHLSDKISMVLLGAIVVTTLTIGAVLFWMSEEHNQKSANDSQTMVIGGLEGIEHSLKNLNVDYSWWQDALDNILAENSEWVYNNLGTGVKDSGTVDLLVIVQPDGRVKYGWQKGSGQASDPKVLKPEVVRAMIAGLADVPVADVRATTQFMYLDADLYLLSAARVSPNDPAKANPDDLPVNIMGFIMDEERINALGKTFLIDDLHVSHDVETGEVSIPFQNAHGAIISKLVWTPPEPGHQLLVESALPVTAVLALFTLLSMFVAGAAHNSAKELSKKEKESHRAARTDSLTGLPNRFHFVEHLSLKQVISACQEGDLGVLFLDLDGFKHVNDTIGHAGGDELIREVSRRLLEVLPEGAFLARVGGDEFNIVVVSENPHVLVKNIADVVIDRVKQDFVVKGRTFTVSASLGYAVADVDLSPQELVRRADVAMYEAKNTKQGVPLNYSSEYESVIFKNKRISEGLRLALSRGELEVHYQPIVSSNDGEMKLVEALVRWNYGSFGYLSPSIFVPIAEETGLINDLGLYVFNQVCKDMIKMPELNVSVNVSPIQLLDPTLLDGFMQILDETGISAERIEIELTEGILVSHPEIAKEKLELLKAQGFSLSLDDFGTGFSSIGYLRKLPFDKLKIDRSFITGLECSSDAASLMHSIANLGRALHLSVVAEAVETEEQAKLVRLAGCDLIQGYLYSKPLPFDELRSWNEANEQEHKKSA